MVDVRGFSSHDETTMVACVAFFNSPGFRHLTGSSGRACVVIHDVKLRCGAKVSVVEMVSKTIPQYEIPSGNLT
jgi:hypothetical protein